MDITQRVKDLLVEDKRGLRLKESALAKFSPGPVAVVADAEKSTITLDGPIVDSLTGRMYESMGMDLGMVTPDKVRKNLQLLNGDIEVLINSPGGSVFDASDIISQFERVMAAGRKVRMVVTGVAASAAGMLALKGSELLMYDLSMLMVHQSSVTGIGGNAQDFRRYANLLDKIDNTFVNLLTSKSDISVEDARKMVEAETWFTANEAVDLGIADAVIDSSSVGQDPSMDDAASPQLLADLTAALIY